MTDPVGAIIFVGVTWDGVGSSCGRIAMTGVAGPLSLQTLQSHSQLVVGVC